MSETSACARPRIWGTLDPFVEGGAVLGRRIANSTFLEALLRADPFDAYHFFLPDEAACRALRDWAAGLFPALERRGALLLQPRHQLQARLADTAYHCMHLSDVLTSYPALAQLRNAWAGFLFPLTGVTHSLSYARYMPGYLQLLWPGFTPRDAILTSSESARRMLERTFAALRRGYGLDEAAFPAPRLERVPLGVDLRGLPGPEERWDAAAASLSATQCRARAQSANGAALALRRDLELGGETVFLCLSRFSPHSKMDLLPLFSAFRRAFALGLPKEGHALILAGWAEPDDPLPAVLAEHARGLGIRTRLVLRPDASMRRAMYAAADVFVSPSDNIQETFGLTLAEAAASGLPVIASDFDGYRDIVLPERTGLLVPTLGFARSEETDLQSLFWFDNQYHLKLAQQTVVDVPALAGALARLCNDAALRWAMGRAARARALSEYAWERVLERYVALWDALAAQPLDQGAEARARAVSHPLRMRFAESFAGHFSRVLDNDALRSLILCRTPDGEALYRGALPLAQYAGMETILDAEAVRRLLLAARRPRSAGALLATLEAYFHSAHPRAAAHERAACTLLWALKHDYLETSGETPPWSPPCQYTDSNL